MIFCWAAFIAIWVACSLWAVVWTHLLEENIVSKMSDMPCSIIFIDIYPMARDIKERINKWDYIKLKCFCTAKENISKTKSKPTVLENIFANDTSNKGLISKI